MEAAASFETANEILFPSSRVSCSVAFLFHPFRCGLPSPFGIRPCCGLLWTPYVDSDVDEEFEFKNVETGKGNRFREDKNVSNNHILKKEIH